MSDNTVLNPGAAGDTIATDEIAGVKHQRVKVEFGEDGSATDVSLTNPMPLQAGDGKNVALGATTDSAVVTDVAGTVSGKLRGLVKILADVWDSVNHWLKVSVQGTPTVKLSQAGSDNDVDVLTLPAITGSVTANAGTNLNTSGLAVEAGGHLASLDTKDFATQATLALIKAKTDNIPADPAREGGVLATAAKQDTVITAIVLLDTDLKATQPRDVTDRAARLLGHVTVDSGGGGTEYADGATTSPSTGKVMMGVVGDTIENYVDKQIRPLSLTTQGRLRVSTYPALTEMEFFRDEPSMLFDVPRLTSVSDLFALGASSPFP